MLDVRIILVEPAFEESIGFVARAMKNFGLSSLHLINPHTTVGDLGRMRGAHAQDILDSAVKWDSLQEALEGVELSIGTTAQRGPSSANLLRRPMTPSELGSAIRAASGTVGIVFGREGTGLNNVELGQCDALVTIPAASDYQTLNLSHAAAIVFYELYKSSSAMTSDELASEEVKQIILEHLSDAATVAGLPDYKIGLAVRAFRNVLGRSAIRQREGSLLAGVMRQIQESMSKQRLEPQVNQINSTA